MLRIIGLIKENVVSMSRCVQDPTKKVENKTVLTWDPQTKP